MLFVSLNVFGFPEHAMITNTMTPVAGLAEEQELVRRGIEILRGLPHVTKVRRVALGGRRNMAWEPP